MTCHHFQIDWNLLSTFLSPQLLSTLLTPFYQPPPRRPKRADEERDKPPFSLKGNPSSTFTHNAILLAQKILAPDPGPGPAHIHTRLGSLRPYPPANLSVTFPHNHFIRRKQNNGLLLLNVILCSKKRGSSPPIARPLSLSLSLRL